jgi:hypothetical protein
VPSNEQKQRRRRRKTVTTRIARYGMVRRGGCDVGMGSLRGGRGGGRGMAAARVQPIRDKQCKRRVMLRKWV